MRGKWLLVLYLVSFAVCILSLFPSLYRNISVKSNFIPKENAYPYEEALKNGTFDISEIEKFCLSIITTASLQYSDAVLQSPVTISYYCSMEDAVPIYVINKGDWIVVQPHGFVNKETIFEGIQSIPSGVGGWRMAKPFSVRGNNFQESRLLYVKYDDLRAVAKEYLNTNAEKKTSLQHVRFELPLTWISRADLITLWFDRLVYYEGIYLSPDLYSPIFSMITYISFGVGSMTAGLALWLRKRDRTSTVKIK